YGDVMSSNGGACPCSADFFFQAEDGIRDLTVTGVQTCALPILSPLPRPRTSSPSKSTLPEVGSISRKMQRPTVVFPDPDSPTRRSEERRVGKECRSRWPPSD